MFESIGRIAIFAIYGILVFPAIFGVSFYSFALLDRIGVDPKPDWRFVVGLLLGGLIVLAAAIYAASSNSGGGQ